MHYVESPEDINSNIAVTKKSIFLAGGISNCPDWQSQVVAYLQDLDVIVYNPRRKNFDMNALIEESRKQIAWEFEKISDSSIVLFWFPRESICPIALYELGRCNALFKQQEMIVGTDIGYTRKFDVIEQTRLANNGTVFHDLQKCIDTLRDKILSVIK